MKDTITEKGLFERLIRLETKLDMMEVRNKKTDLKFTWFALIVIIIEIFNLFLNYYLYINI